LLTPAHINRRRYALNVISAGAVDVDPVAELTVTVVVEIIAGGTLEVGAAPIVVVVASTMGGCAMPVLEQ
jgi:hypothetical protein